MAHLPDKNGPWVIHERRVMHESKWLKLTQHKVTQPDGSDGDYGVVHFKNIAIGILPLDEAGNTWLVGQHRFALDEYSWELPEGGGALDVDPVLSAARELEEECGLIASRYELLCEFYTSNSVTDERALGFIAWGLSAGVTNPDPSEELALRKITFAELLNNVISGQIRDGFTVMMVLSAYMKAQKGLLPEPVQTIIAEQIKAGQSKK